MIRSAVCGLSTFTASASTLLVLAAGLAVPSTAHAGTGANAELTDPTPVSSASLLAASGSTSVALGSLDNCGASAEHAMLLYSAWFPLGTSSSCGGEECAVISAPFWHGGGYFNTFPANDWLECHCGEGTHVVGYDSDGFPTGDEFWSFICPCSARGGGGGAVEKTDNEGLQIALPSTPNPVTLPDGDKIIDNIDLYVKLTGQDYTLRRGYASDPNMVCSNLVGENWTASPFCYLEKDGNDLRMTNWAGTYTYFVDQSGTGNGPWSEPWATNYKIDEGTVVVDTSTYAVWIAKIEGGRATAFYRSHAGGGGITATPPTLEGLPLQSTDLYGNTRNYNYTIYGTSLGDPSKEHARLAKIECHRYEVTPVLEATIEFMWQDNDALPNKGKLLRVSVKRPDGGGEVETQRTLYTYKAAGDSYSDATGTEGDLIQVQRYLRLDNSTASLSTWRQAAMQYRYHGGIANETSADLDGDGFIENGSAHQIKSILRAEQVEYYAQDTITNDASVASYDDAIENLLKADDGAVWYVGSSNITADLLSKLVSLYETTGEKRVKEQWLLSSCGCSGSGSTLGQRLNYNYYTHSSGDFANTVKVDEYIDNGAGTMVLDKTTHYAIEDIEPGSLTRPMVTVTSVDSGSDRWVSGTVFDSDGRLERTFNTLAVASFVPGTASTAPTLSLSTSAGAVHGYMYAGSSPYVTEVRVSQGNKANLASFNQYKRYTYDTSRPWLLTSIESFVEEAASTSDPAKIARVDFDYGFYSGDAVAWRKMSYEDSAVSENGGGGSGHDIYFLNDESGRDLWVRDSKGSLGQITYGSSLTGSAESKIANASNTIGGSWAGLTTTSWGTAGESFATNFSYNDVGFLTSVERRAGTNYTATTRYTRVLRPLSQRPGIDYVAEIMLPHVVEHGTVEKFTGPAVVSWQDAAGKSIRRSTYLPDVDGNGNYDLVALSNSLGSELSRSVTLHTVSGLVTSRRSWHDVANNKYAETSFTYDELGRVATTTDPDGTISRFTYDVLDRRIKTEVGTVASGAGADMVTVSETFFDSAGTATQGVGDGRVTLQRVHVDGSTTRDTTFEYDYRGRRTKVINPAPPHVLTEYDNLGRVTRTAAVTSSNPTTIDAEAANRLILTESFYSQRGQVYKTRTAIDPTATGGSLAWRESHSWFDERGRTIASWSGGAATKTEYDALGRVAATYITDRRGDAAPGTGGNYADAASVADDVVLQQTVPSYITDTGLVDLTTSYTRAHDALVTDTGGLDALASAKKITTYSAQYYDGAGRGVHTVAYGTNTTGFKHGGTAPTVNQTSPPTRTASGLLMSSVVYDNDGSVLETIAPDGTVTRTLEDDMGRTIATIENYVDADITGWNATTQRWDVSGVGGAGKDVDRVTTFTYSDGGQQLKRVAHPTTGTVQETQYVYEPDPASGVQSYGLLKEVRYPDTGNSGEAGTSNAFKVRYEYNRLGQPTKTTDQNGTVHEYTYDSAGRKTRDEVTAFGTGVDQWIDRIETTYDSAGRREYVRSKDGTTVKNAVKFMYDDSGRLIEVVQDVDGDIGGTDDLSTMYAYDDQAIGSGNYSRADTLTYPDGTVFTMGYGSAGSVDDAINRLSNIDLPGGKTAVSYEYLGTGMLAELSYDQAGFILDRTLAHNGSRAAGEYPGYDQFGRVVRHVWADDTITTHATDTTVPNIPPVIELEMAYDKASNRTRTIDARPGASRAMRDEVYSYDGLNRLVDADRGVWNGSALTSVKGSQAWALDALGNWETAKTDLDADGTYEATNYEIDPRDHNEANEYTGSRYEVIGDPSFIIVDLDNTYDDSGNMSKAERRVGTSEAAHDRLFDAWDRLVQVKVSSVNRARYSYNGLNWRTLAQLDTDFDGTYDQSRELYYDASWRLLEERVDDNVGGGGAVIDRVMQQLWGSRYIDDSVFRRQGTPGLGGTVSYQTPWYDLTGPMYSVMARAVGKTGKLTERVRYRAYGEARHSWSHDIDGDGDADSTDSGLLTSALGKNIEDAGYDADADLNRDGAIDSSDASAWSALGATSALTPGLISDPDGADAVIGWDGYVFNAGDQGYTVRHRSYAPQDGRWLQRDPAGYVDGGSLYYQSRTGLSSSGPPSTMPPGIRRCWNQDMENAYFSMVASCGAEHLGTIKTKCVDGPAGGGVTSPCIGFLCYRRHITVKVNCSENNELHPCSIIASRFVHEMRHAAQICEYGYYDVVNIHDFLEEFDNPDNHICQEVNAYCSQPQFNNGRTCQDGVPTDQGVNLVCQYACGSVGGNQNACIARCGVIAKSCSRGRYNAPGGPGCTP